MSRILLVNQGHTNNLGDQAIDKVLSKFLSGQQHEVYEFPYEVQVEQRFASALDRKEILPKMVRRVYPLIDHMNLTRLEDSLCLMPPLDAVVIGGGELLADHRGFNSSFATLCNYFHKKRIPVLVTGVSGNYPNDYRAERYRAALHKCAYISVRDHSTEKMMLDKYGIKCAYAPDVVFSYQKLYSLPKNSSRHLLCVPVPFSREQFSSMGLHTEEEYADYLISQFNQTNLPVLFSSTVKGDLPYVKHLADLVQQRTDHKIVLSNDFSFEKFMEDLSSAEVVISGRMHACILGVVCGVAIKPIPYREKLATFSSEYSDEHSIEDAANLSYQGLQQLDEAIRTVCRK